MTKHKDLNGERFGRLTVLSEGGRSKHNKVLWRCRCDCGIEVLVVGSNLISGNTTSCGCFRKDYLHSKATIPDGHRSRLYRTWSHMKSRCFSKNDKRYARYGGRGVTVCDEWLEFPLFYEWATNNGYRDDLTLERIDLNGNYCPDNCTWIPFSEQASNRSNNHLVEWGGQTKTIAEWSRITGIHQGTLWNRIKGGWCPEKALTTPPRSMRKKETAE